MSGAGPIVVLNGAPRSGKTSVARALQRREPDRWVALGVDRAMAATPADLLPGIGLRPGGERPDLEPHLPGAFAALYDEVVAESRAGHAVVVDVGHHDSYSRPLGILGATARTLDGLPAWLVGVRCGRDEMLRRRAATGFPSDPVLVDRWDAAVHDPGIYDIEVDTSVLTPDAAADVILARLAADAPRAWRRLRDHR